MRPPDPVSGGRRLMRHGVLPCIGVMLGLWTAECGLTEYQHNPCFVVARPLTLGRITFLIGS